MFLSVKKPGIWLFLSCLWIIGLLAGPLSAQKASADILSYPDYDASCQFGASGGASCTNPANSSDKYDWYVDENVDGQYSGYSENLSGRGYYYRNCTDYVAWKLQSLGVPEDKTPGLGNGGSWYTRAQVKGLPTGTTAAAGAAAVQPGSPGHVAYVESVNTDGTITVSEYNKNQDGTGGTRTGTASGLGFTQFVYFASYMTNPPAPTPPNGSVADIYAVVRNDVGSNRTATHVINGANWGQYLLNSATGLPMTGANWSFDWGDLNRDGKLDLWAFNRNPGGINTVVHVLNGANLGQWLQAGNIALPATDANWSFKLGDFNRDGVPDIYGINRAPGWPNTVVHVINGANWGQYLQAGSIALPSTDANWDFDVADFNRDGTPDIWGINRAPGYTRTVVHVINGANWGLWLQAGNIGLPSTDSNWSFAVGDWNGDGTPDIFGVNRAPGYPHTVVHVINGANWGLWWQAGNIVLPATGANWDFAVGDFR